MLERFGLSNYENKVYLALLELGMADARSISSNSDVPYGRIYDILDSLKTKRIINEISGRPKKFTVTEPELAVSYLMEEKEREVKKLQKQANYTIQQLNKQYEGKPKDQLVWKVAIGEELYPAYFDLLRESRSEFLGYIEITDQFLQQVDYLDSYIDLTKQMSGRGVKVKILLGVTDFEVIETLLDDAPELLKMLSYADIKYSNSSSLPYSIIDGEKVILKVVNPVNNDEMLAGVYLWQKSLAKTLKTSFTELWEGAKQLKLAIQK